MATGSYDRTIRMWRNGEALKSIAFPWSQVNCLCISPDRRFLAAGGYGVLRVYDLSAPNPESTQTEVPVPAASNVTAVALGQARAPGGWTIVMGAEDGIAAATTLPHEVFAADGFAPIERRIDHQRPDAIQQDIRSRRHRLRSLPRKRRCPGGHIPGRLHRFGIVDLVIHRDGVKVFADEQHRAL